MQASLVAKTLTCLTFLSGILWAAGLGHAQETESASPRQAESTLSAAAETGPRYSEPIAQTWEFGLSISATGEATGINASVPVPVDWPEQQVRLISTTPLEGGRVDFRELAGRVRQMTIKINRMAGGQTIDVVATMAIDKRHITAPDDPAVLVFAQPVPRELQQYLRPSPYIESSHRRIAEIAATFDSVADQPAWQQVKAIYSWVRDNVRYQFDTEIQTCLMALDRGQGDCEELSSLFIAICRARGIPARAVWIPGHTYPEFYLVDQQGNGYWIPCQAAGDYEFGAMAEDRPVLQKGDKFNVPGHREPLRYVQPTLTAKDSAGGLAIEWIMRRADP